jgi:golgi-specific brefeldin A-resistance guanine nucleotide exchange factor 1
MGDFHSLSALLLDHGCKYLFQLARSDSPAVLSLSLRTISIMFDTMRPHLKLQQELFLAFTIDRLAPPLPPHKAPSLSRKGVSSPRSGTPVTISPMLKAIDTNTDAQLGSATPPRPTVSPARGETRELMLETLSQISRHPNFMVDLYVNYDCDLNCENMFERLVDFLTKVCSFLRKVKPELYTQLIAKGVYSTHQFGAFESQQQSSQYLCLDLVLAFVDQMAKRTKVSVLPDK